MNQIKTAFQQTSVLKIKWYLDLSLNVVNDKGEDLGIATMRSLQAIGIVQQFCEAAWRILIVSKISNGKKCPD